MRLKTNLFETAINIRKGITGEGSRGDKQNQPVAKTLGEGTRGGKIIGHTRNGHPIYEALNRTYQKIVTDRFGVKDHHDAYVAHMKEAEKHGKNKNLDRVLHHSSMAQLHHNAILQKVGMKKSIQNQPVEYCIEKMNEKVEKLINQSKSENNMISVSDVLKVQPRLQSPGMYDNQFGNPFVPMDEEEVMEKYTTQNIEG